MIWFWCWRCLLKWFIIFLNLLDLELICDKLLDRLKFTLWWINKILCLQICIGWTFLIHWGLLLMSLINPEHFMRKLRVQVITFTSLTYDFITYSPWLTIEVLLLLELRIKLINVDEFRSRSWRFICMKASIRQMNCWLLK